MQVVGRKHFGAFMTNVFSCESQSFESLTMLKSFLVTYISLFFFSFISAQKATTIFNEPIESINFSDKRVRVHLLTNENYGMVTNGFSYNVFGFELNEGVLEITIKKQPLTGEETLVIFYPRDAHIPKVAGKSFPLALNSIH